MICPKRCQHHLYYSYCWILQKYKYILFTFYYYTFLLEIRSKAFHEKISHLFPQFPIKNSIQKLKYIKDKIQYANPKAPNGYLM